MHIQGATPLFSTPMYACTEAGVEGVGPSGGDPHCREHRRSEVTHLVRVRARARVMVMVRVRVRVRVRDRVRVRVRASAAACQCRRGDHMR